MDSFSWSDSVQAVFGTCLPCLRTSPHLESEDEGQGHHHNHATSAITPQRITRARSDELEGLLADSDDAETMSLHSNIGDRERNNRRGRKKRARKGIRLFGFDLFGRSPPIHLTDDEEDGEEGEGRRRRRSRGVDGSVERTRTISTSTLDSDASPLDPSTIDELSAARLAARVAQEEEERRAKEERRRKRRERKELRGSAMALAMSAEGEFEGFQGSGPSYGQIPSPFRKAHSGSSSSGTHSPHPHEDFGPFEQGQLAHQTLLDDEADAYGADFGAESYTKRSSNNSNGTGSDSRSRTSASNSNADSSRYNFHYLSENRSRSNTLDGPLSPPPYLSPPSPLHMMVPPSGEDQTPKKKKKKTHKSSGKSSRHSISTTSQSTALSSPPPHQANLPFAPSPMIVPADSYQPTGMEGIPGIDHFDPHPQVDSGFPSVGLRPGGMSRKNSEAGVFLARRGDE